MRYIVFHTDEGKPTIGRAGRPFPTFVFFVPNEAGGATSLEVERRMFHNFFLTRRRLYVFFRIPFRTRNCSRAMDTDLTITAFKLLSSRRTSHNNTLVTCSFFHLLSGI